jgi:hypothetical protein
MRCLISLLVLGWLFSGGIGCGATEEPLKTYFFSGTATSTTVDASNVWVFIRFVPGSGMLEDHPAYVATCQFNGPSCDYQINDVVEGTYSLYGVVDMDDDAIRSDPLPGSGDMVSPSRPLIVFDRAQMDFPDEAWRLMP